MRLERLREERGVSAREVARRIGEPAATVARWFAGESEPRLSEAAKLARYFDVSLDTLGGIQAPPPGLSADDAYLLSVLRDSGLDRREIVRRIVAPAPAGVQIGRAQDPQTGDGLTPGADRRKGRSA